MGLIPETVVEDRGSWSLAVNVNQDLLGKTMLVLNRPCTAVIEVQPGEWADLHDELRRLVPALAGLFQPDQFNFAFLMNQAAQVHLHVIPRYSGPRAWAGLTFSDAHWGSSFGSEQRRLPDELLQRLAAELREALRPMTSARAAG
jgi:diadenosine tetraphosphate (Ap4A) HIT family hydrolase